jgi:hypothetical protein
VRYTVIDLHETRGATLVAGHHGKVIGSFRTARPAQAFARIRILHGDVFVVVLDSVTGAQVYPPLGEEAVSQPRVTHSDSTREGAPWSATT